MCRGHSPSSLRIAYLDVDDVPDGLVWTGDVRYFQEHGGGEESLLAAFRFLEDEKARAETGGQRVLGVSKDFTDGVHTITEGADALESLVHSCYGEPDVPVDWNVPGLHLATHVRAILLRAYCALEKANDGRVLWDDLWDRFREMAKEDSLLGRLDEVVLWAPERWVESLGREVICLTSWKYVPPEGRRLAKKYTGDVDALKGALERNPNAARTNYILSALSDLGVEVGGYISAERAGRPAPVVTPTKADTPPTEETKVVVEDPSDSNGEGKKVETYTFETGGQEVTLTKGQQIEVDGGRSQGWVLATVSRVQGRWLYYRLGDDDTRRIQAAGLDIVWRVPEAVAQTT